MITIAGATWPYTVTPGGGCDAKLVIDLPTVALAMPATSRRVSEGRDQDRTLMTSAATAITATAPTATHRGLGHRRRCGSGLRGPASGSPGGPTPNSVGR